MLELSTTKSADHRFSFSWNSLPNHEELSRALRKKQVLVRSCLEGESQPILLKAFLTKGHAKHEWYADLYASDQSNQEEISVSQVTIDTQPSKPPRFYDKKTKPGHFQNRGLSRIVIALSCAWLLNEGYDQVKGTIAYNNLRSLYSRLKTPALLNPTANFHHSFVTQESMDALDLYTRNKDLLTVITFTNLYLHSITHIQQQYQDFISSLSTTRKYL